MSLHGLENRQKGSSGGDPTQWGPIAERWPLKKFPGLESLVRCHPGVIAVAVEKGAVRGF